MNQFFPPLSKNDSLSKIPEVPKLIRSIKASYVYNNGLDSLYFNSNFSSNSTTVLHVGHFNIVDDRTPVIEEEGLKVRLIVIDTDGTHTSNKFTTVMGRIVPNIGGYRFGSIIVNIDDIRQTINDIFENNSNHKELSLFPTTIGYDIDDDAVTLQYEVRKFNDIINELTSV